MKMSVDKLAIESGSHTGLPKKNYRNLMLAEKWIIIFSH